MTHSNTTHLTNIITTPTTAFYALKEKPSVLFPFALIIAASVAMMACFFVTVDFTWLIDQMVTAQSVGKSDAEIEGIQKGMDMMSIKVMGISSIVGMIFGVSLYFTVFAGYLFLVNKLITTESISFKSWFSLVCWCSIPFIFSSLASILNILLANGQITLEAMNPLSFNNLFFHLSPTDKLFGPVNSWDPITIWSIVLTVLGVKQWTGKSLLTSTAIVLAPSLIIYGIWIAIALN